VFTNKTLSIYTDGACSGNPGKGGWAFVIINDKEGVVHQNSDKSDYTTNNIMEMTAVVEGLKYIIKNFNKEDNIIKIYTDSTYVKNGITSWIKNWKLNNWKTASRKDVKNKEIWIEIDNLSKQIKNIEWLWVKAHNGNKFNELVDSLARSKC